MGFVKRKLHAAAAFRIIGKTIRPGLLGTTMQADLQCEDSVIHTGYVNFRNSREHSERFLMPDTFLHLFSRHATESSQRKYMKL